MGSYDTFDSRFGSLVIGSAAIEQLWTGGRWTEGPVYVPAAKAVVWSDIPEDRILRYDETSGAVSVFEHPCGYQNGHTLDAFGRIVACEHGGRRISRLGFDGRWETVVDRFNGKRLNSPNDVVSSRMAASGSPTRATASTATMRATRQKARSAPVTSIATILRPARRRQW